MLAAVRELNRLENVGTTLRHTLNTLAVVVPEWLTDQVPAEWFDRYGPRFEQYRLPKQRSEQLELAETFGKMGCICSPPFMRLPIGPGYGKSAVETLRQVWLGAAILV